MIRTDRLTKRFGTMTAVDGLSLAVDRGEVLGFLGPNGAGKSTTMKMLTGFLRPTEGRVEILGNDIVTKRLTAQRHIGYLPEGAPAWPEMTSHDFLVFIARTRGLSGLELKKSVDAAAERARLDGFMRQSIDTLSKGYRRRVGLAQALLHDPEILILDEPTDGLDPNQKHEVRQLITEMAGDKAIIVSTHILEEVEAVCTRAVIIARGRLLADGTPTALEAEDPRHGAVLVRVPEPDLARTRETLAALSLDGRLDVEDGSAVILYPRDTVSAANVSRALGEQGIVPERLEVLRGRLDTVFRQITSAPEKETGEAA